MSEIGKERVRKWIMYLLIPAVTLIIGYLTLNIEMKVLGHVKTEYVPKTEIIPINEKLNFHTAEIRRLDIDAQDTRINARVTETKLNNITEILNEIKNDVKTIKKQSSN